MPAARVFLPVLGAPFAHAPVLRFDLARMFERPISRRLSGENKTWRGALMMTAGTLAATLALHRLPAYRRRLPEPIAASDPALVGTLLGLSMWVGELPNSFVKRRLGIAPGGRRGSAVGVAISVFDQADWVPTAWVLLCPVWRMSAREGAQVFVLAAAVHMPVNLVGYALGVRRTPI